MSNMYLIYNTQGDSYLKMIGKSGEVWANKSVDLSITTVF